MAFLRYGMLLLLTLSTPLLFAGRYTGMREDVQAMESLDVVNDKLAERYCLKLLNSSTGHLADAPAARWGLSFSSNQSMTIEEARPMAATMARALLHRLYHDPVFRKLYAERGKSPRWPSELTNEALAFRVAFWDSNIDRPLPPSIAQIRFCGDTISYYYADGATQALQAPITETLTDVGVTPDQYSVHR